MTESRRGSRAPAASGVRRASALARARLEMHRSPSRVGTRRAGGGVEPDAAVPSDAAAAVSARGIAEVPKIDEHGSLPAQQSLRGRLRQPVDELLGPALEHAIVLRGIHALVIRA